MMSEILANWGRGAIPAPTNDMQTITHQRLAELLAAMPGARPVGILADVDARARKTGNPFGTVVKTVRAVGFVGAEYKSAVIREGGRQGEAPEFKADPLPWGEWLIPNRVIAHKGALYMRTQTTPGMRRHQPARVLGYKGERGESLTREQVAPFLPPDRESAKQQGAGLQETVWVRTYAFSSIKRVRLNGQTYKVA